MKIRYLILAALFFIAPALTAQADQGNPVLVKVNDGKITAERFRKQLEDLPTDMQESVVWDEKARREFVDDLIRIELVLQEALKQDVDKSEQFKKAQEETRQNLEKAPNLDAAKKAEMLEESGRNRLFNFQVKKALAGELDPESVRSRADIQRLAALIQEYQKTLRTTARISIDEKAINTVIASLPLARTARKHATPQNTTVKQVVMPRIEWTDLITGEMNQWLSQAREAAYKACRNAQGEHGKQFMDCVSGLPESMQTHSWSIPLYAKPSKTSKRAGKIKITGRALQGFTTEFLRRDGTPVPFTADDVSSDEVIENHLHTVLDRHGTWVLLPKNPFPTEVWMDPGLISFRDVKEGTIYTWQGQNVVILEFQEKGILVREEIPTDHNCGDEVESVPEDKIRKFTIPWPELFDENHHLRLRENHTIC